MKEKFNEFLQNTKNFFFWTVSTPDGEAKSWNKGNIYAVLIAGFVGWLLITATFGMQLKRSLSKLPLIGGMLKTKSTRRRR